MAQLRKYRILFLTFLLSCSLLCGCDSESGKAVSEVAKQAAEVIQEVSSETDVQDTQDVIITDFPDAKTLKELTDGIQDVPYAVLNDNQPYFAEDEYTTEEFEFYSELDELGRCGLAYACIGTGLMPTEERGQIGAVKPSGWHTVKYDIVDGKYLYNRCHLIGYQLTGENANEKNLITGTRYLNVTGMLPFENDVADYIEETGNHVLYRVTPIYTGDNLLADGLVMEGLSMEDDGAGIRFSVYVPNYQPGITIDYATGESWLTESIDTKTELAAGTDTGSEQDPVTVEKAGSEAYESFILNTSSKKFHKETCSGAASIKENNKESWNGPRSWLIENGYSPCGSCKP